SFIPHPHHPYLHSFPTRRSSDLKLVAIRSPHNLFMLDKALADTDPMTTDVVVMTAKVELPGSGMESIHSLDVYDQHLLTVVVNQDRKSTRLNSSHVAISYAVFCL